MDNHSDVEYTLKASYLEVYNEKVQVRANLSNILHVLYYCWLSKKNIHNFIGSMVYLYNCRAYHVFNSENCSLVGFIELLDSK